jgi:hypothetical protein
MAQAAQRATVPFVPEEPPAVVGYMFLVPAGVLRRRWFSRQVGRGSRCRETAEP